MLVFISISTVLTALMFLVALRIEMAAKLVAIRDISHNDTASTESDAGTGVGAVPGAGSGSGSGWGANASDDDTLTEMSPVSTNRQLEHIHLDQSDDDSITEMSPVSTNRQPEHTNVDAASDHTAFNEMSPESRRVAHEESPVSHLEIIVDVDLAKQDQPDCSSPQLLIIDSALPSHKQQEEHQDLSQWEYNLSLCRAWCCSDGATITPEQIKKRIPRGKESTIHGITLATAGGLIGMLPFTNSTHGDSASQPVCLYGSASQLVSLSAPFSIIASSSGKP